MSEKLFLTKPVLTMLTFQGERKRAVIVFDSLKLREGAQFEVFEQGGDTLICRATSSDVEYVRDYEHFLQLCKAQHNTSEEAAKRWRGYSVVLEKKGQEPLAQKGDRRLQVMDLKLD